MLICDLDDTANEAVLLIHWTGGRHTEVRVPRVKSDRYPDGIAPTAVDALRKLAGHWPDRELAVSLNRMRCRTGDGETWTTAVCGAPTIITSLVRHRIHNSQDIRPSTVPGQERDQILNDPNFLCLIANGTWHAPYRREHIS